MAQKTLPLLVSTDLQTDTAGNKRIRAVNQIASELAQRLKTNLELIHVAHLGEVAHVPAAAQAILKSQKSALENLANPFAEFSRARFVVGHPVTELSKGVAKKGKYELLVQGSVGRTGIARALVGSVAEEVIRHAAIPILTVGPEAQKHASKFLKQGSQPPLILFATDLTPASRAAENFALSLARRLQGTVLAVHHLEAGFHPILQTAVATPSGSRELQDWVQRLKREAQAGLNQLEARFGAKKVTVRSQLLTSRGGTAAQALIAEAKKASADLIVMGTHSRNLLVGSILGSTARGTILGAPVPVITVRK